MSCTYTSLLVIDMSTCTITKCLNVQTIDFNSNHKQTMHITYLWHNICTCMGKRSLSAMYTVRTDSQKSLSKVVEWPYFDTMNICCVLKVTELCNSHPSCTLLTDSPAPNWYVYFHFHLHTWQMNYSQYQYQTERISPVTKGGITHTKGILITLRKW